MADELQQPHDARPPDVPQVLDDAPTRSGPPAPGGAGGPWAQRRRHRPCGRAAPGRRRRRPLPRPRPLATLLIYPEGGHGFHYQGYKSFTTTATTFIRN